MNVACPRHPSTGTMPVLRPRRLSENKPATSAITSLRDDEVTERCHGYQNYFFSLRTRPPNRTTLEAGIQTSARSSRQPCLALHRCAPPVQRPLTTGNSSELFGVMSWGLSNSNVTSEVTGQACPRHSACPACPGVPWGWPWSAPRGHPRKAGCAQCVPLIEQF
jgi:hypothetical protein